MVRARAIGSAPDCLRFGVGPAEEGSKLSDRRLAEGPDVAINDCGGGIDRFGGNLWWRKLFRRLSNASMHWLTLRPANSFAD